MLLTKVAFAWAVFCLVTSPSCLAAKGMPHWTKSVAQSLPLVALAALLLQDQHYHELASAVLRLPVFHPLLNHGFLAGELGWQAPRHQCCGERACTNPPVAKPPTSSQLPAAKAPMSSQLTA